MAIELAGRGAMAEVFRGEDTASHRTVAIKVTDPGVERGRLRWDREIGALSSLRAPGVIGYVDDGELPDGRAFLVMEWVEGETLRARLARGRLTVAEALPLFRRLAEALAHIHAAGLVHCDLKPANVLLPGSELSAAIIADLGLARSASDASATATGAAIGTPAYMAPEQARGDKALRATADVFSLGALMYECLTGRPPFRGDSVIAVLTSLLTARPEPLARSVPVPGRLDATVQAMLSRDPQQRPSDGAAVLRSLEGLDDEAELASPVGPVEVRGELRPATILLARTGPSSAHADAETVTLVSNEGLAPPHIHELFAPFGCALEVLEEGTLVGVFSRSSSPRDQATLAARAALALRAALPGYCVTLTTGRALAGGARESLAADSAEVALTMLGAVEPDAVYTDDVTAALLAARFFTEPRRGLPRCLANGATRLRAPCAATPCRSSGEISSSAPWT